MRYLLDTNILLKLPHRPDPQHQIVRDAVRALHLLGHTFVTTRQNAAEFWNVCTRPASARGGLGLSVAETARRLRLLERGINILSDPPSAYMRWKQLVIDHAVSGVQVHDARIAAAMLAYRIKRILTLNPVDFVRYSRIKVLTPHDVMSRS